MIALARNDSEETQFMQNRFLEMAPQIRRQALRAFRNAGAEARAELTQEAIALAFAMFVRLVRRGKAGLAYPTPLADYSIRQVRAGRRVGCRQNVNDIMSPMAHRAAGPTIPRLACASQRRRWFEPNVMRRSAHRSGRDGSGAPGCGGMVSQVIAAEPADRASTGAG